MLRHLASNPLPEGPIARVGVNARRLKRGWDNAYPFKSSLVDMRLPWAGENQGLQYCVNGAIMLSSCGSVGSPRISTPMNPPTFDTRGGVVEPY